MAAKHPTRYIRTEEGSWQNLPACAVAKQLGLYYRIRLDTEIDWIKYRNRLFLKAYTQNKYQVTSEITTQILELVASHPGITYWELLCCEQVNADDINALIATQKIYIDLSAAPLAAPEKVYLFRDQLTANAYAEMVNSLYDVNSQGFPTEVGSSNPCLELTNGLTAQTGLSAAAMEYFKKASPEALSEANRKYQIIQPYLKHLKRENETVPLRTISRWKASL